MNHLHLNSIHTMCWYLLHYTNCTQCCPPSPYSLGTASPSTRCGHSNCVTRHWLLGAYSCTKAAAQCRVCMAATSRICICVLAGRGASQCWSSWELTTRGAAMLGCCGSGCGIAECPGLVALGAVGCCPDGCATSALGHNTQHAILCLGGSSCSNARGR